MSSTYCRVEIGGHLAFDPDIKTVGPRRTRFARLRLLTLRSRKNGDGVWIEEPIGHTVIVFGPLVDLVAGQARKGMFVEATGGLRYRTCPDQSGKPRHFSAIYVAGRDARITVSSERGDVSDGSSDIGELLDAGDTRDPIPVTASVIRRIEDFERATA